MTHPASSKSAATLFYIGTSLGSGMFRSPKLLVSPTEGISIFLNPVKVMELGSLCWVHFQHPRENLMETWCHTGSDGDPLPVRGGQTPSLQQFSQSEALSEHEGQTGIGSGA